MMSVILFILGLSLFIAYPGVAIICSTILVMLYMVPRLANDFKVGGEVLKESVSNIDPRLRKIYGAAINEDGVINWDKYHEDKVDKMFKPGFEDDPEWQEGADRLRKYMAEKRKESDREMQEEINEELNKKEREFWTKRK